MNPTPAKSQMLQEQLNDMNNNTLGPSQFGQNPNEVSVFRGSGAGYVSDRLGLGERAKLKVLNPTPAPAPVVTRAPAPAPTPAPAAEEEIEVINVQVSSKEDRDLIAANMAKIGLLIMENNMLRYQIERTDHQLSQKGIRYGR